MSEYHSGFLRGLVGTSLQLWQLEQARQRQITQEEQSKEHLKLLQQQLKGHEADRLLKEINATKAANEIVMQSGLMKALGGVTGPGSATPALEGTPQPKPSMTPDMPAPATPTPATPTLGEAQGRLQLLEGRDRALQQTIQQLMPFAISEEGKRVLSTLQTEQTNVRQQAEALRKRLEPGTTELEQYLDKPIAFASPAERRAAQGKISERRLEESRQQQAAGLGIVAKKAYESTLAAEAARNKARKEEILLPTAKERDDYRASMGALVQLEAIAPRINDPEIQDVFGPLFSENPMAAVRRKLGERFTSGMTDQQREFIAELGRVVAEVRKEFMGLAQTPTEVRFARTYLPTETDLPATVRAKLQAMIAVQTRALESWKKASQNLGVRVGIEKPFVDPTTQGAPSSTQTNDPLGIR